jgi:hypothetical protein
MNDAVKAITEHLSPTAFQYLLVDIGRPFTGSASSSSLPLRIRLEAFVRSHFIVEAGGGYNCTCHLGTSDQCTAKQYCGYDSNCSMQMTGCGPGPNHTMTCDGTCYTHPEDDGK